MGICDVITASFCRHWRVSVVTFVSKSLFRQTCWHQLLRIDRLQDQIYDIFKCLPPDVQARIAQFYQLQGCAIVPHRWSTGWTSYLASSAWVCLTLRNARHNTLRCVAI